MRRLLLLFSLLSGALFTGCETYQPPVVANGKITNPTIGFNGYEMSIPAGLVPANDKSKTKYEAFVKEISENFVISSGSEYDLVQLKGVQMGVALIVGTLQLGEHATYVDHQHGTFTTAKNRFGLMSRDDQMNFLGLLLERLYPQLQENVTREVELIAGRPVGVLTETFPKSNATGYTYIALGNLTEMFILIGAADDNYSDKLKANMDSMIESLKVF